MDEMTQCTKKEIDFSVFLMHKLAEKWGKTVPETYLILMDTDVLDGYILKCYDTLHTLGIEYLANDLTDFVNERGVAV
jgi:hypothetical protein